MPDTDKPTDVAAQLRRALNAVQDMRSRLEAAQAREHEPVAIVGIACRFPGGDDAQSWWTTLASGTDAIEPVPAERWDREALYDADPDAPGKMSTKWGGFIANVDRFDAAFFAISPREAVSIDPQQRLLLETSWHALEDAGQPPDRLAGSRTGVYVGMSTNDYSRVLSAGAGAEWIDSHASTGNSVSVAAGRIAYTLGLQGPAMVIDTACSSSLVAVHQAVRALRGGEIGLALAAGVNLTLLPELTIGFSKARMMAADGRCKTFDAAADGYVRGEGCGVVVLKRLADAIADGDTIHAVIRGSAVNHDGRSNGLTAPNGPAQVAVVRAALADAKVEPAQVSLIEAHGTGTPLGDPIEARALAEVFGSDRASPPMLASVKTQVGHLEAAAGMAGLIKLTLALRAKTIPPHLHFSTLNPHIANDGFPFRVPTKATPWQPIDGRWIAGVSSFGFSGTNAHVILEAAPVAPKAKATSRPVHVLPISARDPEALDALRASTLAALSDPSVDLAAFANTLGAGRAHHAQRIAVVADTRDAAVAALRAATPVRTAERPSIAFLFTGQGCQYASMARGLLAEPRFRQTLERCDAAIAGKLGASLVAMISGEAPANLARTDVLQPLLFAIEYAVADLWRSWGIEPDAVIGHSLGEIAAACFAGAMSLEDAIAFVLERGRLMQACEGRGSMAAALAPAEKVSALIASTGATIAAYNAPNTCVIAGDVTALTRAIAALDAAGIASQKLEVATAFHSSALDSCLADLERAAAKITPNDARLPIASNLDGHCVHAFDAAYWKRQAREPVRFAQGLQALAARGCRLFLEVGPHPVLSGFGRTIVPDAAFVPSLRRGADDVHTMSEALAKLYAAGVDIDWKAHALPGSARASAPRYPFRRDRHWPDARPASSATDTSAARGIPGKRLELAVPQRVYETLVTTRTLPFLADHVVFGEVVAPGAMHTVFALAALQQEGAAAAIEDVVFEQALVVPEGGLRTQLVIEPVGELALKTLAADGEWTQHASARVGALDEAPARIDVASLQAGLIRDTAGPDALFAMLAERGIELGPAFRGSQALWRGDGEALAEVTLPASLRAESATLPIHPAMLDACFQALGATFTGPGAQGGFLPLSIDRVRCWRRAPERIYCHVRSVGAGDAGQVAMGNFTLCDEAGDVVMTVEGLQIKRVEAPAPRDPLEGAYLVTQWVPQPLGEAHWAQPAALVDAARPHAMPADARGNALADDLERLAEAFAADALSAIGLDGTGVQPSKARLFRRVAQLAARHRTSVNGTRLAQQLREKHAGHAAEIDLVARCGAALAAVMRGETDPLQLIFPNGDDKAAGIYGGAGLAQRANAMAAAALDAAIARRAGRPLRVIEVGAGTGATTELALPVLAKAPGSHYLFTDVSPAFLRDAETRFGNAIETALFDAERAPREQKLDEHCFDVVIAANVVHATARIDPSLAHLRALLAPGGVLILVESTRAQQWWDIVFGLTDGWWRFADTALRPDHPLLDAASWRACLANAGFASSESVGVDAEERISLVVADAPPVHALVVDDERVAVTEAVSMIAREAFANTAVVYTGQVLEHAFELVRAMAMAGRDRLYLVTRGARSAGAVTNSAAASLWGLGEVAVLEHPELRCRRIDIDAEDANAARLIEDEVRADDSENAVSYANGVRHLSRLAEAALPSPASLELERHASYLVVGAFGGLGPLFAEWLAQHGAGNLVLVGRREPSAQLRERLARIPATIHVKCADVTDAAAMEALFAEIRTGSAPLRGIFHLAGGTADGALISQEWPRFASVLGAKADGARLLDRLSAGCDLKHFVMFSTSASLLGNLGQANHAAANACLDSLAHERHARGLPGLSVNWGAWSQAGAVVEGEHTQAMSQRGARSIAPADGFAALARAMASGLPQVGVIPLDWPQFLAGYGDRIPPFFSALAERRMQGARGPSRRASATARPVVDLRKRIEETAPESRVPVLEEFLRTEAAQVLGMADASRIDPEFPLNELGLDSLLALELRNRLGAAMGAKQPATLLFNYPTVAALVAHFAPILVPLASEPSPNAGGDDALGAEIAAMSEAELAALIDGEFEALQKQ